MKSYSNLTVSKLFGTWQKLHPEQEEARTESYRWQQNRQEEVIPQKPSRSSQSDDDDAYLRLLRIKEAAERKNAEKPVVQTPAKQTEPAPHKSTGNHGVGSPDHFQEFDFSMLYYLSHSHFT